MEAAAPSPSQPPWKPQGRHPAWSRAWLFKCDRPWVVPTPAPWLWPRNTFSGSLFLLGLTGTGVVSAWVDPSEARRTGCVRSAPRCPARTHSADAAWKQLHHRHLHHRRHGHHRYPGPFLALAPSSSPQSPASGESAYRPCPQILPLFHASGQRPSDQTGLCFLLLPESVQRPPALRSLRPSLPATAPASLTPAQGRLYPVLQAAPVRVGPAARLTPAAAPQAQACGSSRPCICHFSPVTTSPVSDP